jgi:hypothetical protein
MRVPLNGSAAQPFPRKSFGSLFHDTKTVPTPAKTENEADLAHFLHVCNLSALYMYVLHMYVNL